MNFKRLTLLMLIAALMLCASAQAEASLTARVDGRALKVAWSAAGEGTLTLYVDDWPMEVLRVQPSGSLERAVDASHRYSARLKLSNGCLTANAELTDPVSTPLQTAIPTAAPTSAPTPVPTAFPTVQPTPVPTAVPTATPAVGANQGDLASRVVDEVNAERANAGLGTLRVDPELTRAARVRAGEIAVKFSHTRPDGSAWSTVSAAAYGENIAMGQQTVDKVMAAWMTSQGHRENILRPSFGSIGVAAYRVDGVMYWVQLFGK